MKSSSKEEIKFSGASITCPKCSHHWMRKPSNEERLYLFGAGKATFKDVLNMLDGGRCAICHKRFKPEDDVTIDHIIPKARGGRNHWRNYQLAHKGCNHHKGAKLDAEDLWVEDILKVMPIIKVKAPPINNI